MQSVTMNLDEDGASLVDQVRVQQIAKWQYPTHRCSMRSIHLSSFHWPTRAKSGINYKDIRTKLIVIERSMMSMLAPEASCQRCQPNGWISASTVREEARA